MRLNELEVKVLKVQGLGKQGIGNRDRVVETLVVSMKDFGWRAASCNPPVK